MMGIIWRKGGYLVFILPLRWWEEFEGKGDIWCSYSPWDDGKNLKERGISGVHIAPEMMGRTGRKGEYLVIILPWYDGKDWKEMGISGDYIALDMMGRMGVKYRIYFKIRTSVTGNLREHFSKFLFLLLPRDKGWRETLKSKHYARDEWW